MLSSFPVHPTKSFLNPFCTRKRMTTTWSFSFDSLGTPDHLRRPAQQFRVDELSFCVDRFSFRFQKAFSSCELAHVLRKNHGGCLICDSLCCRTSCVVVQPCTPRVLPNTETFLLSCVFSVTSVVPAFCQIMYSLSASSDGTISAAPGRSVRTDLQLVHHPWNTRLCLIFFLNKRWGERKS